MSNTVMDERRNMALRILTTAMAILRDDEPFDPEHTILGHNFATHARDGHPGTEYCFENPLFSQGYINLYVRADPADRTADRTKVKQVPTSFTVFFSPLAEGITRSELEELLPLDIGYWIDGKGNRQPGNEMPVVPPQIGLHGFRYRATSLPISRFPVDVELSFGAPDPESTDETASKLPVLMAVFMDRNYSGLVPKKR